jgi:hypothetical protein
VCSAQRTSGSSWGGGGGASDRALAATACGVTVSRCSCGTGGSNGPRWAACACVRLGGASSWGPATEDTAHRLPLVARQSSNASRLRPSSPFTAQRFTRLPPLWVCMWCLFVQICLAAGPSSDQRHPPGPGTSRRAVPEVARWQASDQRETAQRPLPLGRGHDHRQQAPLPGELFVTDGVSRVERAQAARRSCSAAR